MTLIDRYRRWVRQLRFRAMVRSLCARSNRQLAEYGIGRRPDTSATR